MFWAKHVPGLQNDTADALSHSQWERFCGLAMEVDVEKTPMPEHLWQIGTRGFCAWW